MTAPILWFSLLVILSNNVLGNVKGQSAQRGDSSTVFLELQKLTKAVESLQAKIESQTIELSNFEAKIESQTIELSNFEAKVELHINNLETKVDLQGSLLRNLETLLGKVEANVEIQATAIKELVNKEVWQEPIAQSPTNRTIVALECDHVEIWCVVHGSPLPEMSWTRENGTLESDRVTIKNNGKTLEIKNVQLSDEGTYVCVAANGVGTPASQSVRLAVYGNCTCATSVCNGVIAGSSGGALMIHLISAQTKLVSSAYIQGVTFDWNSRRIYYLKYHVGIMRSNLNGSEPEILLSDTRSYLKGMTIEPTSGNLYYGNLTSRTIRVCDSDAKKCSTIVSGNDLSGVRDVVVHLSKGLLFWSIAGLNAKIVRANLDGSEAKVLLDTHVLGLAVDELEDRLYWCSHGGIKSCDINGQDIRELPNIAGSIWDVAIDNDKVYYANYDEKGVYVTSKIGTNIRKVAHVTGIVNDIAVFGTRVSNKPLNPCSKAKCAHLCVLVTRLSYRCTCPDGQVLNADGKTCNI